ncbi:MAG TPA: hypothetical protein VFW66_07810 [Gemmatimonadales bacterium]|nr:hypothetical protein [Gemmatimonadales bacterium]
MAKNDESGFTRSGAAVPGSDLVWEDEDRYWQDNFQNRPYALGNDYERYRPAYRYGFESARHHMGRTWDQSERDLRAGWDRYDYRGEHQSTWDDIKDAVRDAWDRVTGHGSSTAAERASRR